MLLVFLRNDKLCFQQARREEEVREMTGYYVGLFNLKQCYIILTQF